MIMHNTVKIHSPPRYVKMNTPNVEAMTNVMNEIKADDIYDRLNKNKDMPSKLVTFYKYKHNKSAWIN